MSTGTTFALRDRRLRAARRVLGLAILGCVIAVASVRALAQEDELSGRVGRVAAVDGTLNHAPEDGAGEWSQIGLNYPVAQGDNLWVGDAGRAEVDYGGGEFRLADDTNVHVSRLYERQLALFIAAGRVIVRVRVLEPDDAVRIDTPAAQIELVRPGLYRIDVAPDSPLTTVIVREGLAQVATASGIEQVMPGQTASLAGVANEPLALRSGGGIDDFDRWSAARDRVYEAPRQNAYVSRQMIGQADLDAYGTWQAYPEYGGVWFPTVEPDWAPYRFGYWTWLPGWGYTWVDQAPWGYAPFHYGRWAYIGGRWGWCPGAFVARPLWAPALVAWYGGPGWRHPGGRTGPVYGWVPLGWREPLAPWWGRCNDRCWTRYNHPYAVNVAERRGALPAYYANWRVPGGITAVSGAALTGEKPVAINRVPVGTGVAFVPSLVTRPPAIKPDAPVRPARRPGGHVPVPASTLDAARVSVPPASLVGRGAAVPFAPLPPSPRRADAVPPAPPPVRAASPGGARAPLRIDDGRQATLPGVRATPVAPALPVEPGSRAVAPPAPVVPTERSLRPVPPPPARVAPQVLPAPVQPLPRVAPAVPAPAAPATIPHPVPPAGAVPPPAPLPPVQVAPSPPPVAPVPAPRAGTVRVPPPNPGPPDRGN